MKIRTGRSRWIAARLHTAHFIGLSDLNPTRPRGACMYLSFKLILCGVAAIAPLAAYSQQRDLTLSTLAGTNVANNSTIFLPDAPVPQEEVASVRQQAGQAGSGAESSSQAGTPAPPQDSSQTQEQKADQQLREEEKQRVLGVVPTFNVTYRFDAVSLSAKQKMELAIRSSVDPFTFAAAFLVAGYHEALDDDTGFGWGAEGFGKRAGAAYLDAFNGTIIGNGILPAVLHQDPRYFRLGHGTKTHRLLYSLATTVICKHDNTGKWEPNYSNVAGNIISGAISNLYYPSNQSGAGQTITNGLIVTAEGTVGAVFQEFWPDISRKILHRDPTHGLDAQAAAADKTVKTAKTDIQ
jgi:hypothetical protein